LLGDTHRSNRRATASIEAGTSSRNPAGLSPDFRFGSLGRTDAIAACFRNGRSWRNLRLQPKTASSRFTPVHRADLQGQERVDGGRSRPSQKGGERAYMGYLGKDRNPGKSRCSSASGVGFPGRIEGIPRLASGAPRGRERDNRRFNSLAVSVRRLRMAIHRPSCVRPGLVRPLGEPP
jgi:hypothetical protein